jgi:hypothetical protein
VTIFSADRNTAGRIRRREEMSTLPIQASPMPQVWPIPGFARVVSLASTVLDVFTEAHQQALAAHKRFPFADW